MNLRPYQQECLQSITSHWLDGVREQLVVLPTGCGKTRIMAELPKIRYLPGLPLLFIVQTDEQCNQAVRAFQAANPGLQVEVEMAERRASSSAHVVVGSVQTLSVAGRMENFARDAFRIIVADEAHHAVTRSMLNLLEYFQALKDSTQRNPRILLLGCTATPSRTDAKGLNKVFSKIVFKKHIEEMIRLGYLADVRVFRVVTDVDISDVPVRGEDFAQRPLSRAVNTPSRNRLVVGKYLELAGGLPFLAFSVDVQHAHDLADEFLRQGISCKAISGETPMSDRRTWVEQFQAGQITGLVSCGVFREGFDAPRATVALMAAPTRSSLLYTQEVGRVLRRWPPPEANPLDFDYHKQTAIVIDFCDSYGEHRIFNAATLFGLNADFDLRGARATETIQRIRELERRAPGLDVRSARNLEEATIMVQEVRDPFSPVVTGKAPRRWTRFAWVQEGPDAYRLSTGWGEALVVVIDQLEQAQVIRRSPKGEEILGHFGDPAEAFAFADMHVPIERIGLLLRDARWRRNPPTEGQCEMLWKLDQSIRLSFPSAKSFYEHVLRRYRASRGREFSRGMLSERIDAMVQRKR